MISKTLPYLFEGPGNGWRLLIKIRVSAIANSNSKNHQFSMRNGWGDLFLVFCQIVVRLPREISFALYNCSIRTTAVIRVEMSS